jgi:RNA polymerase sigma-70 factor (ECF subfamily)
MAADPDFAKLLLRVRAGDSQAAAQLVQQFEPEIRRYVRVRLTDPALYRLYDADDVLQSVLGNFFVRLMAGQFDLDQPEQLIKLLVTMAHNKIVDKVRTPGVRRRSDCGSSVWGTFTANGHTPSDIVAREEILNEVQHRLTAEEKQLVEQRDRGRSWKEIASACGGTPEALRKKLERALDRVCGELGLDEQCHA